MAKVDAPSRLVAPPLAPSVELVVRASPATAIPARDDAPTSAPTSVRLTVVVLALAVAACTGGPPQRRETPRPSAGVDPSRPSRALVKPRPDEPDDDIQPCPPPDPAADRPISPRPAASISAPGPAIDAPQPGPRSL